MNKVNRKIQFASLSASTAAFLIAAGSVAAWADSGSGLPGDRGRMMDGILPLKAPPMPAAPPQPGITRAPRMAAALQAVQAIAEGCKQYKLGIAVANSEGAPILVYVPDGSAPNHGYTAIRKAYSAIAFQGPTTPMVTKAREDAALAARIKADPNLMAFKGGLPLKVGSEIIGAIGVSGAEPGGHDDDCAQIGVDKIKDRLQ